MRICVVSCLAILLIALIPALTACDPMTDPVVKADLIVLGTVTGSEHRTEAYNQSDNITLIRGVFTYYRLSVEKVIKGDASIKEVSIKTYGGPFGDGGIAIPVEAYFDVGDRVLAILVHEEGTTYAFDQASGGVVWSVSAKGRDFPNPELQQSLGRIIKIMLLNHIPVVLPESEWPPLPLIDPAYPPLPGPRL